MFATSLPSQFDVYQETAAALGNSDYSNRLVHYTSVNALQSMLATKRLWFGKLSDLNDTAECTHFLEAVIREAPNLIGAQADQIAPVLRALKSQVRDRTYVSSWCEYSELEPAGRLSMWRAYAQQAEGVAIVIDSAQLQPSSISARKLGFHVFTTRVDYVAASKVVEHANELFRKLASVESLRGSFSNRISAAMLLLAKAPCVKHDGFREEGEIRFLFMPGLLELMGQPSAPTYAKVGDRTFFALPLCNYDEFDLDLRVERVLKKVIVGPSGDKEGRVRAVRGMLEDAGLGHVALEICDIPLR